MPDPIRDQLTAAVPHADWCHERDRSPNFPCACHHDRENTADALLPVVESYAAQQAAKVLEAEAAYDDAAPDEQYARGLFARRLRQRARNLRYDGDRRCPAARPADPFDGEGGLGGVSSPAQPTGGGEGEVCTEHGWHVDGRDPAPSVTPDSDLRDEIREAGQAAVNNMAFDWYCPSDERLPRVNCRPCVAEVVTDALLSGPVGRLLAERDRYAAQVQAVEALVEDLAEDSRNAKTLADGARARGDREMQRINMRHARVAHHAAAALNAALAAPVAEDGER